VPSGILIIDKPEGWTSMDVCAKLRGILKEKRIGHAGTLDPMATGVLPVFVGQATKAVSFAENGEKEYVAGLKLGLTTNTQDTSGETLSEERVSITLEQLQAVLPRFTGEIQQIPPMYSAIKVGGKKLYELARKGVEVERKSRKITIFELEVVKQIAPDEFILRVRCSKGTYIRTLCHDIGEALGCGGCMSSLRRTMAAGFTLAEAVTMEDAQAAGQALLLPTDSYFRQHPALYLPEGKPEKACRNGAALPMEGVEDGLYRIYSSAGEFLCLSRAEGGILTAVKNFFGA